VLAQAGDPGELDALLLLELFDLRPLALQTRLPLGDLPLLARELGSLGIELLVLLVQAALVALELGPALPVLELGGLRDLQGLVLGLEDDLLLLGPRLGEEPLRIRAGGGFAAEGEAAADEQGDREADE